MGEISDAVLDGELCRFCGVYLDGQAPGYARSCGGDKPTHHRFKKKKSVKKKEQTKNVSK